MEKVRWQDMRANESGSMVTFVVVGLVLAALVVGGIYAVQQRKEKAPAKTPVAVSTSPAPSKQASTSPSTSPTQKPQSTSSAPSATPKPSPVTSHTPTPRPTPVAVVPKTSTAPLPQTGPSDNIFSALMLATFAGVAVAYFRSIRLRLQLLRQVD